MIQHEGRKAHWRGNARSRLACDAMGEAGAARQSFLPMRRRFPAQQTRLDAELVANREQLAFSCWWKAILRQQQVYRLAQQSLDGRLVVPGNLTKPTR